MLEGACVTRIKKLLLTTPVLLIAAAALADWRDWIDSPNLLSHSHKRFDQLTITGDAPFCMLLDSDSEFVECHYLSEEHCVNANSILLRDPEPEDRTLCVRNPLR